MFKKLTESLTEQIEGIGNSIQDAIRNNTHGPNTEQFHDPIADETQWDPLVPGGSNFRTHKLKEDLHGDIQFKATFGALCFASIFFLVGLAFLAGFIGALIGSSFSPALLIILLFAVVFGGAGYAMLRSYTRPIVFSSQKGYFYKGRLQGNESPQEQGLEMWCHWDDIYALQIISERIRSSSSKGRSSSYRSHELNIIKKDASRINVIDHGKLHKLRADAEILAEKLDVPLWDVAQNSHSRFGGLWG